MFDFVAEIKMLEKTFELPCKLSQHVKIVDVLSGNDILKGACRKKAFISPRMG